ncbi:MAG: hypothetical protein ACQEWM_06025 [Actinomycetota bacterium]
MTITRHTPVIPTDSATAELNKLIDRGRLDLRKPNPPLWLDEWIDLSLYRNSSTAERRQIALDGLERQAQAQAAADAENATQTPPADYEYRPSKARPERILSTRRVRPGTPYVPCAGGCEYFHLSSKPALIYCPECKPATRNKRAQPASTDLI